MTFDENEIDIERSFEPTLCPRCKKVHNCAPVDIEKIVKEHSDAIAREIDAEVIAISKSWLSPSP